MIRTDTHTIGLFFNFNYLLESFYQWVTSKILTFILISLYVEKRCTLTLMGVVF